MNPKLPGCSVLKFECELLDWEFKDKRKDEMTNAERINLSSTLKENGNEAFKNGNIEESYTNYNKASELIEDMFNLNDDEEIKRKTLGTTTNSNLANACIKLKK